MLRTGFPNVNKCSHNWLVFRRNYNLPAILNDELCWRKSISISKIVSNDLNSLHSDWKLFENELSESLKHAHYHQVRQSLSWSYFAREISVIGDRVWLKSLINNTNRYLLNMGQYAEDCILFMSVYPDVHRNRPDYDSDPASIEQKCNVPSTLACNMDTQ